IIVAVRADTHNDISLRSTIKILWQLVKVEGQIRRDQDEPPALGLTDAGEQPAADSSLNRVVECANAPMGFRQLVRNFGGAVSAAVVDDQDLSSDFQSA